MFPAKTNLVEKLALMKTAAPLRIAIEGLLELSLASFLQIRSFDIYNAELYNFIGCVAVLVCIVGYCIFVYIMIKRVLVVDSVTLEDEEYKKHYGGLYDGYKTEHIRHKGFLLLEMLRKICYAGIILFQTEHPTA